MFVLLFTYPSSEAERAPQLDAHHAYLEEQHAAGRYVVWGPASGGRGMVLATGDDREEIETIVAADPFVRERLVECEVIHLAVNRSAIALFQPKEATL